MRILLFDADGKLMHELEHVRWRTITEAGEFIARFDDDNPRRMFVAYRGTFDHLEEWRDRDEPARTGRPAHAATTDTQLDARAVMAGLAPPVVPGPPPMPDPFRPAGNPHAGKLAEAMAIRCSCAELRCPVMVGPSDQGTRAWWRLQLDIKPGRGSAVKPGQTPFTQCARDLGHDIFSEPHEWAEGMWPYGVHNHHPQCPRHPERYNRPAIEEGHPAPGGITSVNEPARQLATVATPEPARGIPAPEDDERGQLVRPYIAEMTAGSAVISGAPRHYHRTH